MLVVFEQTDNLDTACNRMRTNAVLRVFMMDGPFNAPHTIQSAAVMSWPTRNVLYARWSSRESSAAVISGKAVTLGSVFANAKYADVCTAISPTHVPKTCIAHLCTVIG